MASFLEEKLREAVCFGDREAVAALLSKNVDVNSQNHVNGWTALHWACKRGHEDIARMLLDYGADRNLENFDGKKPTDICTYPTVCALLGNEVPPVVIKQDFVPSYIRHPPLNGQVDIGKLRPKHTDFTSMPTTCLPTSLSDELVLKVKIHGSPDPDFIEIEIPKWKLTYNNLLKVCCEELEIPETKIERIRKLPNTRLRNDNDVKRLRDFEALELVLKNSGDENNPNNCYESISTCKHQTILY